MEYLILKNVDRIVNREIHLKGINLTFKAGSRYILLGRTLAGKTSLLRIMAGLDKPTKGKIFSDERDITGVSVRKRSVAMVYQQFINYPSMTVYDNIASPLKLSKIHKDEIEQKVRNAAKILHIDRFLDRLPAELSGGQQQRTAIARALVKDSELLLLDEPLANLDYKLREELREELQHIFRQRKSIVVYTTTEPSEALMLGGNIVILDEGRVLQEGNTSDVFRTPGSVRVARVFSDPPVNMLEGAIKDKGGYLGGQAMSVKGHLSSLAEGNYIFGVHPGHIFMKRKQDDDVELDVTVDLIEISGSESFIHVRLIDTPIVIQEQGIVNYRIGDSTNVFINPLNVIAFDSSGKLIAAPSGN